MSAKYQVYAENDHTAVVVCEKYTLGGALAFAAEIMEFWTDVAVREMTDDSPLFKVVARLSAKGIL